MCRRAEKNSELSQTSKMELLHKTLKRFNTKTIFAINSISDVWLGLNTPLKSILEIPRNLTYCNSFCKVADSKTLISMEQGSTREKVWRKTLLQLTENGRLLWPVPEDFYKTFFFFLFIWLKIYTSLHVKYRQKNK